MKDKLDKVLGEIDIENCFWLRKNIHVCNKKALLIEQEKRESIDKIVKIFEIGDKDIKKVWKMLMDIKEGDYIIIAKVKK